MERLHFQTSVSLVWAVIIVVLKKQLFTKGEIRKTDT